MVVFYPSEGGEADSSAFAAAARFRAATNSRKLEAPLGLAARRVDAGAGGGEVDAGGGEAGLGLGAGGGLGAAGAA